MQKQQNPREEHVLEYRQRLQAVRQELQEVHRSLSGAARHCSDVLTDVLVPSLLSRLSARLEVYVAARNGQLQAVLASIDENLNEGREVLATVGALRAATVEAAGQAAQCPVQDGDLGHVMVNGVVGSEVVSSFQTATEDAVNDINDMLHKPEMLYTYMAERIATEVSRHCDQLQQRVQVVCDHRVQRQEAMLQEAEQSINHVAFLIDKMEGLKGQLGTWLSEQR